jgi:hypothetical protein
MMKTILIPIALLAIVTTSACKKEVTQKEPFEPMDIALQPLYFTFPNMAISYDGWFQFKGILGNLDTMIRVRTGNRFTLADVKSIKVANATVQLFNARDSNSLSSFERLDVFLTIENADSLQLHASKKFIDTFTTSAVLEPVTKELKPYIEKLTYNGFMFVFAGKTRRRTSPMDARVDIVYHLE